MIGQYYILVYVKHKSAEVRRKVKTLSISFRITEIIQYLLIAVFLFVIGDIVLFWHYPTASLALVTAVSYGLNIGLMAVFSQIFFYGINQIGVQLRFYSTDYRLPSS